MNAELLIDDAAPMAFEYLAEHDGRERNPAVAVQLPREMRRLRLRGTLSKKNGNMQSFDTCWDTVWDCARYTESLYDRTLTLPERFQAFARASSECDYGTRLRMSVATKDPAAELREAEERLATKYPDSLVALSNYDIEIGDSSFVRPFKTVTETMLAYCWYQEDELNEILSPDVRARYNRSAVAFYEVGDGLGALGWDPQNPGLGGPGDGVWFWLHQGEIDRPRLLLGRDMRPLSAEDTLLNAVQRFSVDTIMAEAVFAACPSPANLDSILVVDSAHPAGVLELFFRNQTMSTHGSESNATTLPRLMFRNYD